MVRIIRSLSIRVKLLLVFSLLFTVVCAGIFYWTYTFTTSIAIDNLRRDLIGSATLAASRIDGDEHTRLYVRGQEDDADYTRIATWLRAVRDANPKIDGIYTMVRSRNSTTKLLYIASAVEPERKDDRADLREVYDVSEQPQMLQAFKGPIADPKITVDKWGAWFSGYAPIKNSKGEVVGIVGVDMIAKEVIDLQTTVLYTSIEVFVITYLVLLGSVFMVSSHITKPLRAITGAAAALERGESFRSERLEEVAAHTDELGNLARVFTRMALEVQAREATLKQEVALLRIEIDEAKQNRQVAEIIETDYFRDLQEKVQRMRTRPTKAEALSSLGDSQDTPTPETKPRLSPSLFDDIEIPAAPKLAAAPTEADTAGQTSSAGAA